MQALKRYIIAHFPDWNSIITVYAVCVVFVYSWTLVVSFWKIPSWLYYLRLGDILSIYAYSMSVNFIESAILLGTVLGLSMFLPIRWWKDKFISRSVTAIAFMMGSIMVRVSKFLDPNLREGFVSGQWKWFIVSLALATVVSWSIPSIKWLRVGIEQLSERFVVFLYLYLPLTVVSLVVVVVRVFL